MNQAVMSMLKKYNCVTAKDYENALKEIIQEISLLGLWRAKFFDKASFYGGTALRIFHGLPRFSEDLDFTLRTPDPQFRLTGYLAAVKQELMSYGFEVEITERKKVVESIVESAFIKANTKEHIIKVHPDYSIAKGIPAQQILNVKLEVEIDSPGSVETEVLTLVEPIPFVVTILKLPYLFAGKLHAVLQRQWKGRVKGRDYYDLVWYLAKGVSADLKHLEEKLRQSGGWKSKNPLTHSQLIDLLTVHFQKVDFESAKKDILPFINDPIEVSLWSADFFTGLLTKLKSE